MKDNARFEEKVPLSSLTPFANNSRTHSEKQIDQVAESIERFGFLNPLVITEDGVILAGNGRYLAAKKRGMETVPCIITSLSEIDGRAYVIVDNRLGENSEWDKEMLKVNLEDLLDKDFDMPVLAFTEEELMAALHPDTGKAEEDGFDIAAQLKKPVFSKKGDIWHLGRHKVVCGDAVQAGTYETLMGERKANLVITNPGKATYGILKPMYDALHDSMAKDASIYTFYDPKDSRAYFDAYEDAGFKNAAGLAWKKPFGRDGEDFSIDYEPIIWGWRADGKHVWFGDQKQKAVFDFDDTGRGAKPVALIAYLIRQCTQTNGLVLANTLRHGTALIACEQSERTCFGIEENPRFVGVAVERFRAFVPDAEIFVERDGEKIPYNEVPKGGKDGE